MASWKASIHLGTSMLLLWLLTQDWHKNHEEEKKIKEEINAISVHFNCSKYSMNSHK